MAQKILITTAIDYVNGVIHIGHAYQKIVADAVARYQRAQGLEVFYLTGTDEHGSKSEETAQARGISPKELVDEISALDKAELDSLNISYDRFIRTTDSDHAVVVKEFYRRSFDNGDIYLGEYEGLYCVGCETFYKEKDLVNGRCPLHPTKEIVVIREKNYFFAWSKYTEFLKEYITNHSEFVQHDARRSEMLAFLESGIEDLPISRPNVKFGIPVPNDPEHVLYVWFDALINYITGAPEYWEDDEATIIHFLGKDNVRWHALLWPAMLKSAGYRLPSIVYGHDFFTIDGQKISKSLGNILRPTDLVAQFSADVVRYYFLRYGPLRDDVDVTIEEITRVYNADLANGLGNVVARIAKMAEGVEIATLPVHPEYEALKKDWHDAMDRLRVDLALEAVWRFLGTVDKYIDSNRIWELVGDERTEKNIYLASAVALLPEFLGPFIPETAEKIRERFQSSVMTGEPLFPRK